MHMNHTFRSLRSTLPRYTTEFTRAAARHAALAPFVDAAAALGALDRASDLASEERDAIVRAFVAERQSGGHPLWPAMLLLAFEPVLRKLGKRVDARDDEDVEQLLVAALLEATDKVRTDAPAILLQVRWETSYRLFQSLRKGQRPGVEVSLEQLVEVAEVPWHRDQPAFVRCAAREVLRACEKIPGATEVLLVRAGILSPRHMTDPLREDLPAAERARVLEGMRHRAQRRVDRVRRALRPAE
jgi:hypothetical protein